MMLQHAVTNLSLTVPTSACPGLLESGVDLSLSLPTVFFSFSDDERMRVLLGFEDVWNGTPVSPGLVIQASMVA